MKKLIIGLTAGMLIGSAATAFASSEDIGKDVQAVCAKFTFKVNGAEKPLETTPLVYEGTAYLPVREVAKLTGYELLYKEDTRTIELTNNASAASTPPAPPVVKTEPPAVPEGQKAAEPEKKSNNAVNPMNQVYLSELLDAFAKKGIKKNKGGGSGDIANFEIDGKNYVLNVVGNDSTGRILDITPLIEANIITLADVKSANPQPAKVNDPAQKTEKEPEKKATSDKKVSNTVTRVYLFDLLDVLSKKGIKSSSGGSGDNAYFEINGKSYVMKIVETDSKGRILDVTPLIDANIISVTDVPIVK
ncbi:stalk domain-containing protein [Paenibacillus sp. RC67]|uniref:stalk domain-containing protein n=1 Tax=Paenibacillus sp. RC67 TaxID=3039392 RepID=UPI0024ADFAA9|nr:stalk domain-containing protein [Paenibacillus sp. RC67]